MISGKKNPITTFSIKTCFSPTISGNEGPKVAAPWVILLPDPTRCRPRDDVK